MCSGLRLTVGVLILGRRDHRSRSSVGSTGDDGDKCTVMNRVGHPCHNPDFLAVIKLMTYRKLDYLTDTGNYRGTYGNESNGVTFRCKQFDIYFEASLLVRKYLTRTVNINTRRTVVCIDGQVSFKLSCTHSNTWYSTPFSMRRPSATATIEFNHL